MKRPKPILEISAGREGIVNKIDYRLQAIPVEDAFKPDMIGKIVVLKNRIFQDEPWTDNYIVIWGYDFDFDLFVKTPWHNKIYEDIFKYGKGKNKAGKTMGIFLRGEIFFNEYRGYIDFRPVEQIKFIVGNDDFYFWT